MNVKQRRTPLGRHLGKLLACGQAYELDDYEIAKAFVDALSEDGLSNVARALKNTRVRRDRAEKER